MWVGFIALFGTAVQTGMVMVIYLEDAVVRATSAGHGVLTRETLRAAVMQANHRRGPSIINVLAGTYVLTLAPTAANDASSGDLNLSAPLDSYHSFQKLLILGAGEMAEGMAKGFRLRGKVTADAQGNYAIETILPGLYPGRTRHIHVKVTIPGGPTLTSQVYFPNEGANRTDGIFDAAMLAKMSDGAGGVKMATIDFVLKK